MRRTHGYGNVYGNSEQSNSVEEENENLADGLKYKINALKSLSIDIGSEVRHQNKMLHDMDNDFDSSKGILSSTMSKLIKISKAGYNKHILYLILFSFFVFFILSLYLKFK